MPRLALDQLDRLARQLLLAAGTPEDIAEVVAGSLVGASLKGVDSHGVMQLPWYLEEIAKGKVDPQKRKSAHHSGRPALRRPPTKWSRSPASLYGHRALINSMLTSG